jgi:hypothetical protein
VGAPGLEPGTRGFVVCRRLAQVELSSTAFGATHRFARLGHRFNDLSISLFTSVQPSATVMGRPSSLLD